MILLIYVQTCIEKAHDYSTMLMLASCYSDDALMKRVYELAGEAHYNNIQFMAAFMRKDVHACYTILVDDKRFADVVYKLII